VSQICVSILAASVNLSAAYVSATTPSTAVSWLATASLAWTLLAAGVVLVVALWVSFLRTCPDFVGPASSSPNAPSGAHCSCTAQWVRCWIRGFECRYEAAGEGGARVGRAGLSLSLSSDAGRSSSPATVIFRVQACFV
jgi:hypothetical protein